MRTVKDYYKRRTEAARFRQSSRRCPWPAGTGPAIAPPLGREVDGDAVHRVPIGSCDRAVSFSKAGFSEVPKSSALSRSWGCETGRRYFQAGFPLRWRRRGLDRETGEPRR